MDIEAGGCAGFGATPCFVSGETAYHVKFPVFNKRQVGDGNGRAELGAVMPRGRHLFKTGVDLFVSSGKINLSTGLLYLSTSFCFRIGLFVFIN